MTPSSIFFLRRFSRAATRLATLLAALSMAGQTLAQDVPVSMSTLYNFALENPSGASARLLSGSLVQLGDGTLYGTAQETLYPATGLTGPAGLVYKLSPTGEFTPLHIFNRTDGSDPRGLVLGRDGNLYGVTDSPGHFDGNNTVYRITPAGVVTVLHTFTGGSDGNDPTVLIAGNDGNLYGAASQYDALLGKATVFKVTPDGTFTTIYTFTQNYNRLSAMVQDSASNLYVADTGTGSIYEITPAGALTNVIPSRAPVSLISGNDGYLYGATSGTFDRYGNVLTYGTLFRLTPAGVLTTLYTFAGGTDGAFPASLTLGSDGNIYGVTSGGGTPVVISQADLSTTGTVFRITPAGIFTHLSTVTDGGPPGSPLLLGGDGSFYGTTEYGGAPGTLFRLTVQPSFFAGQTQLSDDVYFLGFPYKNYFGFYGFLSDPHYIYHYDLGYEYVFDANDGKSGVYFYDFASNHFFYASPFFPFPYLYDFTLGRTLYYYPDPVNVGHYNTDGVRYFYDFLSGRTIVL